MNDANISNDLGDVGIDRNVTTALVRGLDISRCFGPNQIELTNQYFAQRTGLPKPTVSRLIHTLCALEYPTIDACTGTNRLGAAVLKLEFGVLSGMDIGDRTRCVMRELSRGPNTDITVGLLRTGFM